jgi:integrase
MLPRQVEDPFVAHLKRVRAQHVRELQAGFGSVLLPDASAQKDPTADRDWGWQWLFPASKICRDPRWGATPRRHHLHESAIQKAIQAAAREAGIARPVGPHTSRHCFATHLLEAGYDIRTVQELLGHRDVKTTMVYTHVLNRGGRGVESPVDCLDVAAADSEPRAGRISAAGRAATRRQGGGMGAVLRRHWEPRKGG